MFMDLAVGTLTIAGTVIIQITGFNILAYYQLWLGLWVERKWPGHHHGTSIVVATVLGIFLVHAFEVWLWAAVYLYVGALPDFDTALYFSTVTFTTLGYGDVTMPAEWQLMGALEGMNGFIMIGWSTAFLVTVTSRFAPFPSVKFVVEHPLSIEKEQSNKNSD